MKKTIFAIALTLTALALAALTPLAASAQSSQEPGWRAHVAAAGLTPTTGGGARTSLGAAVGLEYRVSPRLGFELAVSRADLQNEIEFGIFDLFTFTIESEVEATPVLVQLDWHLTPDRRVDVFLGPVAGYVLYGDRELSIRGAGLLDGDSSVFRSRTEDGFAWGAHVGLNAPLGDSNAFFTARASYLVAEVETQPFGVLTDDEDDLGSGRFDLDPVSIQLGIGYRF